MRDRRRAAAPHGHCKTSTLLAALRHDAVAAPLGIDGAINGTIFRASVEQFLVPTLEPGDIVVRGNPSSHKVAGGRDAIERAGAKLAYLPPEPPDLNPIEQVVAKLKVPLRAEADRTVDGLWNAVGRPLDTSTAAECANDLANRG